MTEQITIPREDWAKLEDHAHRLARGNRRLLAINNLLARVSELPGLENVAKSIVRLVLDNLGGTNAALYYPVATGLYYVDALGEQRKVNRVDDEMVQAAMERREFCEEVSQASHKGEAGVTAPAQVSRWAQPLMSGGRLVGVLTGEGTPASASTLRDGLQPFLHYAARILQNEVESYLSSVEAVHLAEIVRSSDDAVIGKTLEGVITSWNRGAETIYGYVAAEVLGRNIALLVPPSREDELPRILERLKQGEHIEHYETKRLRKDGRVVDVSLTISPIRDSAGHTVGASTIARDISGRLHAEAELRRANRALRTLSECNEALVRSAAQSELLLQICTTIVKVGGYRLAWVGFVDQQTTRLDTVVQASFEGETIEQSDSAWFDVAASGGPCGKAIHSAQPVVCHDLRTDPAFAAWRDAALDRGCVSCIVLPLVSGGGAFGVLAICSEQREAFDATETRLLVELADDLAYAVSALRTKEAHEQSQATLQLFRELLNQANDAIFVLDPPTARILDVNDTACRSLGYTREELLNLAVPGIDLQMRVVPRWAELLKTLQTTTALTLESVQQRKDGTTFPVEVDVSRAVQDKREYLIAVVRDVTERKEGERRLHESEERLRLTLESAQIAIWDWDVQNDRWFASPPYYTMLGYEPKTGDADRQEWLERVHPDDLALVTSEIQKARTRDFKEYCYDARIRHADGTYRWQHVMGFGIERDSIGRVIRMLGIRMDINDRKLADEAMKASEERFRDLYENAPNAYLSVGGDGAILRCNRRAGELVGYPPEQLLGRPVMELYAETPDGKPKAAQVLRRFLAGEALRDQELEMRHAVGHSVWVSLTVEPVRDAQGRVVASRSIAVDITERKRAENITKARLGLLELAVTCSLDELLQATLDKLESLTGSQIGFYHFLAPDQQTLTLQAWSSRTLREMCTAEGKGRHYSVAEAGVWVDCIRERRAVIHNDYATLPHRKGMPPGHAPVTRELVVPIFRGDRIVAVLGVGNKPANYSEADVQVVSSLADMAWDIAERRRAEESQRQSEMNLQLAFDAARLGDWRWDIRTGEVAWSARCKALYGLAPDTEMSYERFLASVHPEDRARVDAALRKAVDTRTDYELEKRVIWPDGSLRWTATRGRVICDSAGQPVQMAGVTMDITERKQAEAALRDSEERYRKLIAASPDAITATDLEGRVTLSSAKALEMFRLASEQQAVGRSVFDWIASADNDRARENLQGLMTTGTFPNRDFLLKRDDGTAFDAEVNGAVIQSADGTPYGTILITRDVTERKRAAELVRRLSRAVEQSPASIVITDPAGNIEYVNPKFTAVTGYTQAEVLGQNPRVLKSGEIPPEGYAELWRTITSGKEWRGEFHNRKKNGELYWELASISPILDESGRITHFLAVKEDITERRRMEEEFRQAQKLEAVGRLAGGVAHDFNNILAAILMNLSLLKDENDLPQDVTEGLDELEREANRAASLTRQLLVFSRRHVLDPKPLDLNDVIHNMSKMLRRLIGEDIDLVFQGQAEPLWIVADAGMVDQVLLNLCVNARDAMPEGGQLAVGTRRVQFDDAQARANPAARPGLFACLSVTDSGCGMSEDTQMRIFEPFYTTKEVGKGTGLGLATVQSIVDQHRGWVEVESTVGKGTTFRVYLPAMPERAGEQANAGRPQVRGGDETILLVEDDPGLRRLATLGLRKLGYAVLEATNGQEALRLWQEHRPRIDLLFTDMVMPGGISGLDLAQRLVQEKPAVKILVTSGYSAERAKPDVLSEKGMSYLAKPYDVIGMARAVRSSLDQPAQRVFGN